LVLPFIQKEDKKSKHFSVVTQFSKAISLAFSITGQSAIGSENGNCISKYSLYFDKVLNISSLSEIFG
jgi:hypothetical protein